MNQSKLTLDFGKITYFLWIVYFTAIYCLGNVKYQMPAWLSYFMVAYMFFFYTLRARTISKITFSLRSLVMWYGIFWLWMLTSRLWTPDAIAAKTNTPDSTLRIVAVLIAMDIYVSCREEAFNLLKSFGIGSTIYAVYVFATSPVSSYGSLAFGAKTGQQRNTTGYVLCFASIVLFYLWLYYKDKVWLVCLAPCLVSSLLTGSRKIIFAYGVAFLLFILGQKQREKRVKYFMIIIISAAILIPILYQIPYIRETFGERLLAVVDDSIEDSSIMYRNVAKENAIRIFKESPIIGNGWQAVKNSYSYKGVSIYAHNNYLEICADYGLIGALFFFSRNAIWGIACFFSMRKNTNYLAATILLASMVLLDWGQVSYVYIYMMSIWGVVYKFIQYICMSKEDSNE